MEYDVRFSDANAGAGSQSLGLRHPKTLARGQTVRVDLTDAEADHFMRDEAYSLSIPEIEKAADPKLNKRAKKADKES